MSVNLSPSELDFKRPFDREVCQVLSLDNQTQEAVVFKVKTTAPKHYCVRPNSGRIEPGKHVEVQVLLQAMKEEPAPDAKCKDKFLVQTVSVSRDMEFANVTSIFEKASKSAIQERKIRVNWLLAGSASPEPGTETNGIEVPEDEPPAYTSPTATYETPAVGLSKKTAESTSPIPPPDFNDRHRREATSPQSKDTPMAAVGIPTSSEELKAQLSEANNQIHKLKERLADQGLRQRKIGGETGKATPQTMKQQHSQSSASGVPVQIVAVLCLISFLIAYFLF